MHETLSAMVPDPIETVTPLPVEMVLALGGSLSLPQRRWLERRKYSERRKNRRLFYGAKDMWIEVSVVGAMETTRRRGAVRKLLKHHAFSAEQYYSLALPNSMVFY